jgi:hypothetical protein
MPKNKLKNIDYGKYNLESIRYNNFNCKNPNVKEKEYYEDNKKAINNDKLSFININYDNKVGLLITTPEMVMPFKISGTNGNFSMSLQFSKYKDDENMKLFYNFIRNLEINHIQHLGLSDENLSLYIPQIRRDKEKKYDPTLLLKIPFKYNKLEAEAYNENGELINILNISRFTKMKCDIYIDKIWVFNDQYYCKWKLKTIQLR